MYARCNQNDDVLSSAVSAASFATFARRTGNQDYMVRGSKIYALALSQTNAALANPTTALLDQTLASILLLGVFESTVFPGKRSPEEWTTHLLGASKLLQLRGLRQFKSDAGAQLFTHTANNIRASCIQREVNLPAEFQVLNDEARLFLHPKDPGNKISSIIEEAVRIRARLSNISKDVLYDIFHDVSLIERKAAALLKNDPELAYIIRSKEDTPSWAYLGISYHHKSYRAAKHCNTVRMIRLFLLEVMSAGASLADKDIQDQINTQSSPKRIHELKYFASFKENTRILSAETATEVLGSVPDFIESSATGPRFSPSSRTLVWPLSVVYRNSICPPQAREYARLMSDDIVKDLNRLRHTDIKNLITERGNVEDW